MALAITLFTILPATQTLAAQSVDIPQADTYTVQGGDTLNAIARRAGVTVDALIRANPQIDPDTIYVGMVLRLPPIGSALPATDMSPRASQAPSDPFALNVPLAGPAAIPAAPAIARSQVVYTVQAGDTMNSIALRFATTPAAILEANGPIVTSRLQAGQALLVPAAPSMQAPMTMGSMPTATAPGLSAQPVSSSPRPDTARLTAGAPLAPGFTNAPAPGIRTPPSSTVASIPSRGTEMTSSSLSSTSPAVQIALQFAGSAYVYGGNGPGGFDCSGFVEYVMRQLGRNVPRDLPGQYSAGYHPQGELEAGDLVFFQDTYDYGLSHVGIYINNGNFIHAISEASGVGISNLNEPYYAERWYGATRLPDSAK